jgi:hypothetical protein
VAIRAIASQEVAPCHHFLDAGQVNELAAAIDERYRPLTYGALRAGEVMAVRERHAPSQRA